MLPWVERRVLAPQQVLEGQPLRVLRLGLVVQRAPQEQQEQRHAVLLVWIVQQVRCCLRAAIRAACH